MESDDGQDTRARSGSLHWMPYHSQSCLHRGTRTRSNFTSARTYPTGLYQLEITSPGGSADWGVTPTLRRSTLNWKTNCRSMGPRPTSPNTTYAGAECSSGNAANLSKEAMPAGCSIPADSTAGESASCSIPAGSTAGKSASSSIPAGTTVTKPARYPISAGHAATEETSGERRGSSTSFQ